ncbi:hypothetical protein H6G35_26410 [Aulosira sp. FACHB-113]|uniref:hypothetical protein n=1 Tax=Tolypothrix tenuis TaxID=457083 RepID=UPI00199D803D|nr:hypothetical protein [Aulosira sp. FACHB-113]
MTNNIGNERLTQRQFAQVEAAACGGSPRCADWRGKPAHATGSPTIINNYSRLQVGKVQ